VPGAALAVCLLPWAAAAAEDGGEGETLYRAICGSCHSIELPESQRLDRNTWEWVLEDMVEKFGCGIDDRQRALILEFLVEHRGPDDR